MVNDKKNNLMSAALSIILGVLFIIFKSEVISIAMTILGALLIIIGIIDIVNKLTTPGIIYIVVGALIIVFGWFIATVVLYIFAALLIIYGALEIYYIFKNNVSGASPLASLIIFAVPVLKLVIGILLFFNQGGVVSWVFIVSGIIMIVDGLVGLVASTSNN